MRLVLSSLCVLLLSTSCGDNLTPAPQNYDPSGAPVQNTAASNRDPYTATPPTPLECVPNLDGQISADEVKIAIGASVAYLVPPAGQSHPVDLTGRAGAGSLKIWDTGWPIDYAEDQVARLGPSALTGKWFAGKFPKGQFAVPVDLGGTLFAVNSIDSKGMYIHGVASADEHPVDGQTLLVYDTPITALLFPLKPGGEWTSSARAKGVLKGIDPWEQIDTYRVRADAMGEMHLPDVTFKQVQRIRTDVTIVPAFGPPKTTQKQVSFYFECVGEVARATSQLNETSDDFTNVLEVRRLGL